MLKEFLKEEKWRKRKLSLKSKVREKIEIEFKELEDKLMGQVQEKLEDLKEEVRKASRTIAR